MPMPNTMNVPAPRWLGRRISARLGDRGEVDVERMQRSVGVRAGAVRVVCPGRVGDAGEERQAGVVTEVDAVLRVVGVRGALADTAVRERGAAVGAEAAPELGIVVGNAVDVAESTAAIVV